MLRIQSLVGRVLSRCHGNGSSLRLSNGTHVEDEVVSSTTRISTTRSGGEEGGEQKKHRRTSEFYSPGLTRYTVLDAVGWGVAAVLFMQLCRRIHSQLSSHRRLAHQPTLRILADLREPGSSLSVCGRAAVPGVGVARAQGAPTGPDPGDQQEEPASLSTEEPTGVDGAGAEPGAEPEAGVDEAQRSLSEVEAHSVPVILNIMGLESLKRGDPEAAFGYFRVSAQQNYSKAQFNVGVCYEKGHGVQKDLDKAMLYYRCAAAAGHSQAQYRRARLLLSARGGRSHAHAVSLLQSAAAAGLTQAQLYLGVLHARGPGTDRLRSVLYFRQAAESGDSTALLFLGQCYENGFGVTQSSLAALSYYTQAAAKGNQRAKNTLRDLHSREVLRSIRSAPCLSVLDRAFWEAGPKPARRADWTAEALPHSRSTGCLGAPPLIYDHAAGGKNTSWIIGVG